MMNIYIGYKKIYTSNSFVQSAYRAEYDSVITEDNIIRHYSGKPCLNKNMPFFNLSHSGEYIVCAFDKAEIGIDIQIIKGIPDSIVKKYLRTESLNPKERIIEWTKFESYGKRSGVGIPFDEDYSQGCFISTDQIDGYIITLCIENDNDQALKLVFI